MSKPHPDTARPVPVPSGRARRMAQLGGMTAGIAGNMAVAGLAELSKGNRPAMRDLLLTPGNVRRVTEQLAKMRGAAMKVGQLMSMDTGEMLPPELADLMARLRSDAHFMPPKQLRDVLNDAWPDGWHRAFKRFDTRPIAAASIGQVHRAELRDGRDVAIKVQYPGVARSIDSDVANVGLLVKASGLLPKGFELAPYLDEARAQLHEETDYTREAGHLQQFNDLLAGDPHYILPDFHSDWSTSRVLTMGYIDGLPIEALETLPEEVRTQTARRLITLTLRELFEFGIMQTDPNYANYRFAPETGRIILLDFGATRTLSPSVIAEYRALLKAALDQDLDGTRNAAKALGAIPETCAPEHEARLMRIMEIALSALHAAPQFDFTDMTAARLIQDEGMALAQDGFVPPPVPMDVLFIQRKLAGMFLLAGKLRVTLPLLEMIGDFVSDGRLQQL